jgi:tetratricopeptide (TPR) repeat protein
MRASFEYAWALLSHAQQRTLSKLTVFEGGFTMKAAAAVAEAERKHIATLLDRSLVQRGPQQNVTRLRLHSLVRHFAAEKTDPDAHHHLYERHSRYFLTWLQSFGDELAHTLSPEGRRTLMTEADNIRAAWRYAIREGALERAAESLQSVAELHRWQGQYQLGLELIDMLIGQTSPGLLQAEALRWRGVFLLQLDTQAAVDPLTASLGLALRAESEAHIAPALAWLSEAQLRLGRGDEARQTAERALTLYESLDDPDGVAHTALILCFIAKSEGAFERALSYAQRSLTLYQQQGDGRRATNVLIHMGHIAYSQGRYTEARAHYEKSLTTPYPRLQADAHAYLGHLLIWGRKQLDEAEYHIRKSLTLRQELGYQRGIVYSLTLLADITSLRGDYAKAIPLYEQAAQAARPIGEQQGLTLALTGLGLAASKIGRCDAAQGYIGEALRLGLKQHNMPTIMGAFVSAFHVLLTQGQVDAAAAALAVVRHHPGTAGGTRDEAQRLSMEWRDVLSAEGQAALTAHTPPRTFIRSHLSTLADTFALPSDLLAAVLDDLPS